jgi:FtsZ-interacting cell division protein ZipA
MSDLQIVLIIIGALIILAVVVINWWQEKRFNQQVERSFSPLKNDALLDEPNLDATAFSSELNDDYAIGEINDLDDEQLDTAYAPRKWQSSTLNEGTDNKALNENRFNDGSVEDLLIDDALEEHYDALPDFIKEPAKHEYVNTGAMQDDVSLPKKTAQREDIKAIFEEAFSERPTTAEPVSSTLHTHQEVHAEPEDETPSLPAMVHAQMDLTALLYLAEEMPLGKFSGALTGLFDGYDKPVFVHVLDHNKLWYLLKDATPNLLISKIACSLQLADRGGAVSRPTLNRFQLAVETIGLDINAHVEWQSTGDPLALANTLDAFCIDVDKTIGFHLVHGESGAFTGTKLRGLAESQGLTLADGVFKFLEDAQSRQTHQPSFVMFNRDDFPFSPEMLRNSVVKGVTFQMDIPHVRHCAEAFNTMVQIARQMEIGLNAVLVDDNNKVLGEIQIEKIRQQLKVIHATMLVRGIVPGSESAHRLFA